MPLESRVVISHESDIISARQMGRDLAGQAGFKGSELTVIATAISELARNIISYAGHGEVRVEIVSSEGRTGISVVAEDQGPGIADIDRAMQDGYSTGNSLGLGLPGAKRLMDEFEITSAKGKGTRVSMKKWLR